MIPSSSLTVSIDGQDYPLTDSVEIENLASGMYSVIIANDNGCMINRSELVDLSPSNSLSIDTMSLGGDSLILSPNFTGVIADMTWSASSGIICSNCMSINVDRAIQSDYTVTVIDENGCTYTATLSISNQPPDGAGTTADFYISNTISAIGTDQQNSRLYLQTNQRTIITYDLAVYSRWGSVIFDKKGLAPNDQFGGWDATFSDKIVESGVYIYVVEVHLGDGRIEKSAGDVLVIN